MLQVWRSEGSHVGTELRLLPAVPSSWSWSVCYYYYFCLIWDKDSCSQGWNWTVLQIWATTASPTSHRGLISGVLLAVCFPSCFCTVQGGSWNCQYNDIKWMDGCRLFFLFSIPKSCMLGLLLPPSCLICLYDWQQFPALVIDDFKFAKVATLHYHIRDHMMTSKPSPIRIFNLVADLRAPARTSVCYHSNLERWRKEFQHFFFFKLVFFGGG